MTRRTALSFSDVLLILLALIVAFYIDYAVGPPIRYVSAPFIVPVLFAAWRLSTRAAIVVAILVCAVAAVAASLSGPPFVPLSLHLLGLTVASVLAILLGHLYRESARLAREARDARNTLNTIIETLPAGVLVSDARGTVTRANTAAYTILGGEVTSSAYGPSGGNRLECPNRTPFPAHDLPLARALDRGEVTHDVEIRVLPPEGTERVILAAGCPIRDEEGRVTGAIAIFQDITERKWAEEALRVSEESLARAQQVAHVGNWDRDLRTGQLRWSDEVYCIFGIAHHEFAGTFAAFLQRVHPVDRELITQALAEALTKGKPYSIDHRIVRPDGSVRYVHEEVQILLDASGHPVHLVGTIQDITERKQAEEELSAERIWLQTVVDHAPVGILLSPDPTGRTVFANPRAEKLFGRPIVPEEGIAQYRGQLSHPDGKPFTVEDTLAMRLLRGETISGEEIIIRQPSGREIHVLASATLVHDERARTIGAVAVFEDITALKELERRREEWTSVVAHDLRQPVTVIVGYATSLLRNEANVSVEQRPKIEHILTAARNLNKLVADLLDVSRIEARRVVLQLQPTDLPKLVSNVVERMNAVEAPTGNRHPIQVKVIGSIPPALADPMRIEQILGNLLSNAVKYGTPEGEITITVRQQDDHALVAVTNWGPGIPPDEVARIFTRFYRTWDARAGREAGLGLGLYITKGIVEAHHGRIWVESIPNQTTTFSFTLPPASISDGVARDI